MNFMTRRNFIQVVSSLATSLAVSKPLEALSDSDVEQVSDKPSLKIESVNLGNLSSFSYGCDLTPELSSYEVSWPTKYALKKIRDYVQCRTISNFCFAGEEMFGMHKFVADLSGLSSTVPLPTSFEFSGVLKKISLKRFGSCDLIAADLDITLCPFEDDEVHDEIILINARRVIDD